MYMIVVRCTDPDVAASLFDTYTDSADVADVSLYRVEGGLAARIKTTLLTLPGQDHPLTTITLEGE